MTFQESYKVEGQDIWFRPFQDTASGGWYIHKCNADTGSSNEIIYGEQDSARFESGDEAHAEAARRARDYGKRA